MRRHGPVIAHCTDSEDFPVNAVPLALHSSFTSIHDILCRVRVMVWGCFIWRVGK